MSEDVNSLVLQLKALSPMPPDDEVSEEQLAAFSDIVEKLRWLKDSRCILPLLLSLGYGTGYGLYWSVVHFLERFDATTLHDNLITALREGGPGTRMWSVLMLGRMRDPLNLPYILESLSDSAELVRVHAALSTEMVAGEDAKTYLPSLLDDPSVEVRSSVRKLLAM